MSIFDLQFACKTGELEKIQQAFFQNPLKINEKDSQLGWSALYRTVISGKLEATRFLLEHGADPNTTNNLGETPLHQAADSENYSMVKLLLAFKANINMQQNEGDTPLHHSAFRGDLDMVNLLLESGADPNIKNRATGRTPLHYAVDCGYLECVQSMIKSGADAYISDKNSKTAFDMTKDSLILVALSNKPPVDKPENNYIEETIEEKNDEDESLEFGTLDKMYSDEKLKDLNKVQISSIATCNRTTNHGKYELLPIYDWLEQYSLERYYEQFASAGYSTIEKILADIDGVKSTISSYIIKPGHKDRLIFRLTEEDVKKTVKIKHNKSKSSFLRCCGTNGNNNEGIFYTPDLKKWLSDLHMEVYFKNFVEAGYDDLESLILMADTPFGLNKEKLIRDVKLLNEKHILKVLRKLDTDYLNTYSRNSVGRISFDEPKSVACDSCTVI